MLRLSSGKCHDAMWHEDRTAYNFYLLSELCHGGETMLCDFSKRQDVLLNGTQSGTNRHIFCSSQYNGPRSIIRLL